jgi:tetratricopeptide (TPR) repeat protein
MRRNQVTLRWALAFSGCVFGLGSANAQTKAVHQSESAERLVRAALESECGGPSAAREQLLKQALALDPEFAPARWQSGFVRWNGGWQSLDVVGRLASTDKTLAEYRRLREGMVDTADNQRALAEWCRKHQLPDEARAHWLKLLAYEPNNAEAHAALGLEWFEGRLLTAAQIKEAKSTAKERQQAIRRFRPMLARWRTAITGGSPKQRVEAERELGELSDTAAIPAIALALNPAADSVSGRQYQRLLMEALGRMHHGEATELLVRMALIPDSLELRTIAADQLKSRPMFSYVPQLIAAAPGQMKNEFQVMTGDDGQIVCRERIIISGNGFDYTINHNTVHGPIMDAIGAPTRTITPQPSPGVITAELQGDQQSPAAQRYRRWSDEVKGRIQFALQRTTGFKEFDDPQLWEQQWNEYNGWKHAPSAMEARRQFAAETADYTPLAIFTPMHVGEMKAVSTTRLGPQTPQPKLWGYTQGPVRPVRPWSLPPSRVPIERRVHVCFPAGTPVLTVYGRVPIEKVRSGDRVLSQDPRTGELTYKTVHETTLLPATPLAQLTFGKEKLLATPGHPFWIVGEGWRVARFLQAGDVVHSLHGAAVIDAVEEARPSEVYNLVVNDLHNYFVGEAALLVHDNSTLTETTTRVPGLAAKPVAP